MDRTSAGDPLTLRYRTKEQSTAPSQSVKMCQLGEPAPCTLGSPDRERRAQARIIPGKRKTRFKRGEVSPLPLHGEHSAVLGSRSLREATGMGEEDSQRSGERWVGWNYLED